MNSVPLHAVHIGESRLIELCDVSYAQSLPLLMRPTMTRSPATSEANVVVGTKVPLLAALAPRMLSAGGRQFDDPAIDDLREHLQDHSGQLIFACHGNYDPVDPSTSGLRFGAGGTTTMASLFGYLPLGNSTQL